MQIGNEIVKIAIMLPVTHVDERGSRRVNGDKTEAEKATVCYLLQTGRGQRGRSKGLDLEE